MKFLLVLLFIPLLTIPAFAESQTLSTDKGTLDVKLSYDDIKTGELTRLPIEFINPMTQKTLFIILSSFRWFDGRSWQTHS